MNDFEKALSIKNFIENTCDKSAIPYGDIYLSYALPEDELMLSQLPENFRFYIDDTVKLFKILSYSDTMIYGKFIEPLDSFDLHRNSEYSCSYTSPEKLFTVKEIENALDIVYYKINDYYRAFTKRTIWKFIVKELVTTVRSCYDLGNSNE